jgi:hypothetical protein
MLLKMGRERLAHIKIGVTTELARNMKRNRDPKKKY